MVFLTVLLLVLAALPARALTLVYTEQAGAETTRHTFVIEPAAVGFTVEIYSEREGRMVLFQELQTDPGFSVLRWRLVEEAEATDVTAVRDGVAISLTGLHEGKKISRRFPVGDDPWYQLFPHGLEHLALAGGGSVRFWAIGMTGISAMRIGTFRALVVRPEQVAWNGTQVPAIRVHITLAGLVAILWYGDYWYRPGDGRNLVSISDRGPGTPDLKMELTEER